MDGATGGQAEVIDDIGPCIAGSALRRFGACLNAPAPRSADLSVGGESGYRPHHDPWSASRGP